MKEKVGRMVFFIFVFYEPIEYVEQRIYRNSCAKKMNECKKKREGERESVLN